MKDILGQIQDKRRPRILIRAARHGAELYSRERDLKRHLTDSPLPRHGAALMQLVELEAVQNEKRRANDATYDMIKHVDVLIALMGEARILRASRQSSQAIT